MMKVLKCLGAVVMVALAVAACEDAATGSGNGALNGDGNRRCPAGTVVLRPPAWIHGDWYAALSDILVVTFTDDDIVFPAQSGLPELGLPATPAFSYKALCYQSVVAQTSSSARFTFTVEGPSGAQLGAQHVFERTAAGLIRYVVPTGTSWKGSINLLRAAPNLGLEVPDIPVGGYEKCPLSITEWGSATDAATLEVDPPDPEFIRTTTAVPGPSLSEAEFTLTRKGNILGFYRYRASVDVAEHDEPPRYEEFEGTASIPGEVFAEVGTRPYRTRWIKMVFMYAQYVPEWIPLRRRHCYGQYTFDATVQAVDWNKIPENSINIWRFNSVRGGTLSGTVDVELGSYAVDCRLVEESFVTGLAPAPQHSNTSSQGGQGEACWSEAVPLEFH